MIWSVSTLAIGRGAAVPVRVVKGFMGAVSHGRAGRGKGVGS